MSVDLNMRLSDNFSLWEFTTSQTATRHGLDNTPSETVIRNLRTLCQKILQPARNALGPLRISSGYRSKALNEMIGGSKTSAHLVGYAADVIPYYTTKLDLGRWIVSNCTFDQLIAEFGTIQEPAWIHISCDPRNRKQVLRTKDGGYVPAQL